MKFFETIQISSLDVLFPLVPPPPHLHLFSIPEQATYQTFEHRPLVLRFMFCNGHLVRLVHTSCSIVVKTNYLLLHNVYSYVVSHFTVPVKWRKFLCGSNIGKTALLPHKNVSMNYGVCLYVIL